MILNKLNFETATGRFKVFCFCTEIKKKYNFNFLFKLNYI